MNVATRPSSTVASDGQFNSLIWLAERTADEQKTLREMDDKLFSWSASLFITAFGALAGINGLTNKVWGPTWRALLVTAIIALIGSLLLLAWQIRVSVQRKQADIDKIMAQLNQLHGQQMSMGAMSLDSGLFFVIRWGVVAILGAITLALTWLTFG